MRRQNESFPELLLKSPWWISASLGVLAFFGLRWGLPLWAGTDKNLQMIANGFRPWSLVVPLLFGVFALFALLFGKKHRRLVDEQTSLDSLRSTPWKDFEFLVVEPY